MLITLEIMVDRLLVPVHKFQNKIKVSLKRPSAWAHTKKIAIQRSALSSDDSTYVAPPPQ